MSNKFIPNGDPDFMQMAQAFAAGLSEDPARFDISADEAREVAERVAEFTRALHAHSNPAATSRSTKISKDQARARAAEAIRHAAHLIKNSRKVDDADRVRVGIRPKAVRGGRAPCPQSAPFIWLMDSHVKTLTTPGIHVLRFTDAASSAARPVGAVRIEIFAALLEPGAAIPSLPRPFGIGCHGYLRSYTRSPIQVEYPLAEKPMQVLYWGRWANSAGETGPFSQTVVAPIDGRDWSRYSLPDYGLPDRTRQGSRVIVTSAQRALPAAEPIPDAA